MLNYFINSCYFFKNTPLNKYSEIADILESFYAFNAKIVKKIPLALNTNENIDFVKLIDYGMY